MRTGDVMTSPAVTVAPDASIKDLAVPLVERALERLGIVRLRGSVVVSKIEGQLAVVDGQRGVFRVAEPAPGAAPTYWVIDPGRRWHAFRANRIHVLHERCPQHPRFEPAAPGIREPRCPVCRALRRQLVTG